MLAAPRLIGYRLGEPHERHLPTGTPAVTMRRSIKTLVTTTVLALTAATGAGAAIATAAPASAQVLISYDGGTIHLGQSMQVGVWYQKFSGGPTGYWRASGRTRRKGGSSLTAVTRSARTGNSGGSSRRCAVSTPPSTTLHTKAINTEPCSTPQSSS